MIVKSSYAAIVPAAQKLESKVNEPRNNLLKILITYHQTSSYYTFNNQVFRAIIVLSNFSNNHNNHHVMI